MADHVSSCEASIAKEWTWPLLKYIEWSDRNRKEWHKCECVDDSDDSSNGGTK